LSLIRLDIHFKVPNTVTLNLRHVQTCTARTMRLWTRRPLRVLMYNMSVAVQCLCCPAQRDLATNPSLVQGVLQNVCKQDSETRNTEERGANWSIVPYKEEISTVMFPFCCSSLYCFYILYILVLQKPLNSIVCHLLTFLSVTNFLKSSVGYNAM
jgi:hypothetical protein